MNSNSEGGPTPPIQWPNGDSVTPKPTRNHDGSLPVAPPLADETSTAATNWIERLLSPESLKRLMMCGGGLMIIGFVIWLWTIGVFENPLLVAFAVGGINLAVLGSGMAMVRWSRYQLAGRGLTLLAALAMPLNLWFYDAQGLIVLDEGGKLWIPAAVCCVIYAAVARLLRDSAFVYTLVGGIVMTGMLFLADMNVNRFWELLPHATFLSVVGWTCMLSQFLFAKGDGEFSRERFGNSFHRAGSLVLLGGLGLIAGGQLTAFMPEWIWSNALPAVVNQTSAKLWSLSLIAISGTLLLSLGKLTASRSEQSLANLCFVWVAIILLDLLSVALTLSHLISIIAGLMIVNSVWAMFRARNESANQDLTNHTNQPRSWTLGVGMIALSSHALCQFLWSHELFSTASFDGNWFLSAPSMFTVGQSLLIAVAGIAIGFQFANRSDLLSKAASQCSLSAAGLSLTLAAWSLLFQFDVTSFPVILATVFGLPLAYGIANRASGPGITRNTMETLAGSFLVTSFLAFSWKTTQLYQYHAIHAAILATAAICSGLLARSSRFNYAVAVIFSLACSIQLTLATGIDFEFVLCCAPTILGACILATKGLKSGEVSSEDLRHINAGYSAIITGSLATALMAANRVLNWHVDLTVVTILLTQLCTTIGLGFFCHRANWRLALRATSVATALASLACISQISTLNIPHRIEVLSLVVSSGLLILGHSMWTREGDTPSAEATLCLLLGSLFMTLPLSVGLVADRILHPHQLQNWRLFHELATLSIGMLLLSGGMLSKIRWTTIAGGTLMFVYVASLVTLIRLPEQLQSVSIAMMAGGGLFFGGAILLSVYRDRIMTLPQKAKEGKGVFQVLNWR